MDNLGAILDEFETLDEADQAELMVEEALNLELADEQALDAVEKVAHVAQSSLRRLQQVVEEKDDLIVILQDAVGSAYRSSLDQQKDDQHDLQQLQELLVAQEDRSVQAVIDALQALINQQPSSGAGLGGQIAKLFDQYLHEVSAKHEQETEELRTVLAMYHDRCQDLEDYMDRERKSCSSLLNEKVAFSQRTKSQLNNTLELVDNLRRQLNDQDEQLRVYQTAVEELENMLEEEKTREKNLSLEHERMLAETKRSIGQVNNVGYQLQKLKEDTTNFQKQGIESEQQVKTLQEKLNHQRGLIRRLAVQIAALRKKTKIVKASPVDNQLNGSRAETKKQTQFLQDCIQKLSAQILELERELREAKRESDDPVLRCTQDITLTDETKIFSPRTLGNKSLGLVKRETEKKLEEHDKLFRKVELLQMKLRATKKELDTREIEVSRSGATIEQLRYDLRKGKETINELREKKRKKMERGKSNRTDCLRIKGLLENIEVLEMENALLKHEVMVQKNRQIAKLERELRKVQGADRKQHECVKAMKMSDPNTWEMAKKDLEDIIVCKDSLNMELKFEAEQASWKLAQVEKRFSIMFGALECKKFDLDVPVAETLLGSIFSSDPEEMSAPALKLLREKVLTQRGFLRSGSRKRELQDLVDALLKVVEKLSSGNEALTLTCEDAVKHMEKNNELRKLVSHLQRQIGKVGGEEDKAPNANQAQIIADLRGKLTSLTDANAGLIRALKETEDMYAGLKQRVNEQQSKERRLTPELTLKPRRCSFLDEGRISDQSRRLQHQADTIVKLENDLARRDQAVADLNGLLERKEDELDLLHGKLWIQDTSEREGKPESMYQTKTDMWSAQEANTKYCDVKRCRPEDYVDVIHMEENEWESLQDENRRLKETITKEYGPEYFENTLILQNQSEQMSKVCERYEELLRIYSKQIGVPFEPLRKLREV